MKPYIWILLFPLLATAGDTASFISLGWSMDDKYYAFAQYGEQDGSGFPYAQLFVIDVEKNNYVPGGVKKSLWKESTDPASRGIHALIELRMASDSLLNAFNIVASRHVKPTIRSQLDEREFVSWSDSSGDKFSLQMEQQAMGNPAMLDSQAAFHLLLKRGETEPIVIGNIKRFRKYVLRYDIDQVLRSFDQKSLVIVIRMTMIGFEGPDIRYMVETVRLPNRP